MVAHLHFHKLAWSWLQKTSSMISSCLWSRGAHSCETLYALSKLHLVICISHLSKA